LANPANVPPLPPLHNPCPSTWKLFSPLSATRLSINSS